MEYELTATERRLLAGVSWLYIPDRVETVLTEMGDDSLKALLNEVSLVLGYKLREPYTCCPRNCVVLY